LQSFGISSFYAGVAGSLLAHYLSVITPEHFPLSLSIEYLAIIIVGGLGSVLGSILGASFIILLPEFLNEVVSSLGGLFPNAAAYLPYVKMITFGFIIVAFIIFEPKGLAEIYERVKKYFKLWPYAY
jgi:branched-chain amino acid transport system permease protein